MLTAAPILEAQQACPCPALNELASNVLDILCSTVPAASLHQQSAEVVPGLAMLLCDVIEDEESPIRLQEQAACVLGCLARAEGAAAVLGGAAGG